jgi:hypothetical protein
MKYFFGFFFTYASLSLFGNPISERYQAHGLEASVSAEVNIQREMDELKGTQNPEPDASVDYLFVLSASNSYLKKLTFKNCTDLEDDYNRMHLAFHIAKKIAALKANVNLEELNFEILRRFGPKIVYNGSEEQNEDLKNAVENSFQHYPKEKFIILNLPKNEINTKGQFISLKKYLPLDNVSVGIITHAYHFPRVSRMLGNEAPLYPFGTNVVKYAFLVDRQFVSPGIEDRVTDEIRKIPIYVKKGDLSKYPASDVVYSP